MMGKPFSQVDAADRSARGPEARVYVAMGSNLGDRQATLRQAVRDLAKLPVTQVLVVSGLYETPPVGGPTGQGAFLNAAAGLRTRLDPATLLRHLQAIEADAGRAAPAERERWGPRELDLDILLFGEQILRQPGLKIPHPRMAERAFVLVPLAEIAPQVEHPTEKLTVAALRDALSDTDRATITRFADAPDLAEETP